MGNNLKIYSSKPTGNEASDLQPSLYFNLAIEHIEKNCAYLEKSDSPIDVMRVHIDTLLYLNDKYPTIGGLLVEEERVSTWKEVFFEWYDRCQSKIPKKYREDIHTSAKELFSELEKIAH